MTRRQTVWLNVAAVAALLLLAVWQVPQWLDWNRYRATIEVLASATLGQPVTISGPISLTLLPQPVLTAVRVNVGGGEPTDLSIRVEALRLRVALWPLIGGHVDARELVLRGPDLHIPWPTEPGMLRPRPPAWLAAFAARIENGRLTVGQLAFTGIDATLATLDTGALSASGTARFSGQGWHFTARLTAAGADGVAGLNATLDGQDKANGLGASFTGQLARDGTLAGTIASRGPNLSVLLPTPPVPFRADGRLTVRSGLAAVDGLALEIGGSPAHGAVALRVAPTQRLDIALAASRLDLDAWLPVLLRAGTTIAGIHVPIGFDFSAEAAPLGGGTLEHVRAAFDLTGKDLVVREASALLPGNGTLRLSGRIARDDPASLASRAMRGSTHRCCGRRCAGWTRRCRGGCRHASWRRCRRAWRSGRNCPPMWWPAATRSCCGGSPAYSMMCRSPVRVGFRRGEPPAVTADLSLDRLALDTWLPPRLPNPADLSRPVAGLDAELRLNIRQATLAGTTTDGLAVDAAVEAGNILLRRLEGTVRGARFRASGMLGDGGKLSDGKLSVETKDATRLADLLPISWRATPALWQGAARLDVQVAGPHEALACNIRLALADAQLEASPTLNLKSGEWGTSLALRHPGARRLLATLGLPQQEGLRGLPDWLGDGSLSLVAHLAGGRGRLVADKFDLTAATLNARGDLAVDLSGTEPRVSGHVDTDAVTLPMPNGGSDVPLPLGVLHGWRGDVRLGIGQLAAGAGPALRDASVRLTVADDGLRLDDFVAKLGSGTVSGSVAFDAAANPPSLAVQAGLSDAVITGPLGDAPIDLLSGRADASVRLTASGHSPSVLLATLGGRITADSARWHGFGLRHVPVEAGSGEAGSEVDAGSGERCVAFRGNRFRSTGVWREHRARRSGA